MPNVKSSYLWVAELGFRFFNHAHIFVYMLGVQFALPWAYITIQMNKTVVAI